MPSVTDNHRRLPLPFIVEEVDGVLDDSWVTPVVLGRDEDDGSVFLDLLTPGVSMFVYLG